MRDLLYAGLKQGPDWTSAGLPTCSPGLDSTYQQLDTRGRKLDRMSREESLGRTLLPNTTKSLSILRLL